MAGWKRSLLGGLPIYQAETISWLPNAVQGFTTRQGGVSAAPYDSLNLSLNCGDDPAAVQANRQRLASALGVRPEQMVYTEQVHGIRVALVDGPAAEPVPGADALVTAVPGTILTLLFADCYPVYIVEPLKRIYALVHSGWRGTAANIVQRTTDILIEQFGVEPRSCFAAIGPGIAGENYEVGRDLADRFRETFASSASTFVLPRSEMNGKWELHLRRVIFSQLLGAGYRHDAVAVCEEDTFANQRDFFSHRRESQASRRTGRMAAVLGQRDPSATSADYA